MIQVAGRLPGAGFRVVKKPGDVFRLADSLREEAAREVAAGLAEVSCKRIRAANVPGAGVAYLSRIQHGDAANPLFRAAMIFRLGRFLGVPKERFQRWIDWLQSQLDKEYAAEAPDIDKALEEDSAIDPADDHLRYLASRGCETSRAALLVVKREQFARVRTTILALEGAR